MSARIRLQRKGKKGRPYYHIVVADARSPRDGKYIERIGHYDPNVVPADINIDSDKAMEWLQKGAQPSDTCRAILSYKGVLYLNHLMGGVKKGAFDEAEAKRRFEAWSKDKEAKVQAKREGVEKSVEEAVKARTVAETKKAEEMAAALSAKLLAAEAAAQGLAVKAAEAEAAEAEAAAAEAVAAEAPAEAPATEAPAAEAPASGEPEAEAAPEASAPADEAAPEAKSEEPKAD